MNIITVMQKKAEEHKVFWWSVVIFTGILFRFLALYFTNTADPRNFYTTASIAAAGKNIYANFVAYNYGPLFSIILAPLYKAASFLGGGYLTFKIMFVALLTLTDILMAKLIVKKTSTFYGMLFFINPISMVVDGYNGQFDNLAIMFGAYGAYCIDESLRKNVMTNNNINVLDIAGTLLISLSLITKHILWMFPMWTLFNKNIDTRRKVLYAFVPPLLFFLSFLPYWSEGSAGIIHNVFHYRSSENMPLLFAGVIKGTGDAEAHISADISIFLYAFGVLMMLSGYIFRHEKFFNSFLLYTIAVLSFTSGAGGQQLAIPCMAMVILFREKSFVFFVLILTRLMGKQIELSLISWCLLIYLVHYYRHNTSR